MTGGWLTKLSHVETGYRVSWISQYPKPRRKIYYKISGQRFIVGSCTWQSKPRGKINLLLLMMDWWVNKITMRSSKLQAFPHYINFSWLFSIHQELSQVQMDKWDWWCSYESFISTVKISKWLSGDGMWYLKCQYHGQVYCLVQSEGLAEVSYKESWNAIPSSNLTTLTYWQSCLIKSCNWRYFQTNTSSLIYNILCQC